jgi:hypothetical protein
MQVRFLPVSGFTSMTFQQLMGAGKGYHISAAEATAAENCSNAPQGGKILPSPRHLVI